MSHRRSRMFLTTFCRQIDDLDLATLISLRPNYARSTEKPQVMVIISQIVLTAEALKNHIIANSATTLASQQAISRGTCEPIQENGLLNANSANFPAKMQAISRSTCSLIQVQNHFIAPSASLPFQQWENSNGTCQHIQGRSISGVTSATIQATKLVISRHT